MTYQNIFFDLDHTIWDFEANAKDSIREVFQQTNLNERGIEDFDLFFDHYSVHNTRLWDLYTKGRIKQDVLKWKRMYLAMLDFKIADEVLAKDMDRQFLTILPTKSKVFPYTFEILDYLLEKNYRLHLITNGFDAIQAGKLKSSQLEKYFENVVTSEGSGSLKPKAEIFEYALNAAKAKRQSSIMIGDNQDADIAGANNVEIDTVWVNHIDAKQIIPSKYTITSLDQLEGIL
ncbi:MAG: noncanonical pyrimidine nucleotidase, YjjG family [Pseudopedobacter saltans]|uniref:Noncanonical pyrimidine nucleotidase, YjjG family n=1 Tax=Pseudopedobacter saltans TaxID=151895 RepID=A0A2W5F7M9_9SPHI|nr:MAG: noncanonical pyrimidine nucleotidase, YjjG family [Pseudopedobacter saltans]